MRHAFNLYLFQHLRDFPLYTEAIKFFNNPESMVRIAVRTLTLNVYKSESTERGRKEGRERDRLRE